MTRPGSTEEDTIRGYAVTTFAGRFPNYECVYCQFSTLFLAKMVIHVAEDNHPWAFPVPDAEISTSTEPTY